MDVLNPFGGPVIWVPSTGSTMTDAHDWWQECRSRGQISRAWGAVFGADLQTRGQGRLPGRSWEAAEGQALTFTLVLKARFDFPRSLVLATGIAACLESKGLECRIKWPNDILVGDRKICGILVNSSGITSGSAGPDRENRDIAHFCGIGMNVLQPGFPDEGMRRPPTSLAMEGLAMSREQVLPDLLSWLLKAEASSPDTIRKALEDRLWHRGREMTIQDPYGSAEALTGTVEGIGPDGCLLLSTALGPRQVYSGE